jgi:hypothetical protein
MGYRDCDDLPDDLPDDLREFTDYWFSILPGDGRLPRRADFDLLALPRIVPSLMIIEHVRSGDLVRDKYRYVGTRLCEAAGRELTGLFFDEVWDERSCADAREIFDHIGKSRLPHHWERSAESGEDHTVSFARILCPLATDGENVDMLIGAWRMKSRTEGYRRPDARFTITRSRD